jgi:AcrR family transcriptional regulator
LRSERALPLDAWGGDLPGDVGVGEGADRPGGRLKPGPGRRPAEVADHQQGRIRAGLLEIVAERGYAAVTVRGVAARAGVSTRSFYQHYPNKEACSLSVHQLVVRQVLGAIEGADLDGCKGDQCLRAVVRAIREWASDPRAAHLMLIDAYSAGLPALKQARLAGRSIEARVRECLDCVSDDASFGSARS